MPLLLGIGTARQLILDAETIHRADRLGELEQRLAELRHVRQRTTFEERKADRRNLVQILNRHLGAGDEFEQTLFHAAAELESWQADVLQTVQQLAAECREGT
jgi:molecular chaperone GrpE (heat shock protein)